jgi:hypothetical protein
MKTFTGHGSAVATFGEVDLNSNLKMAAHFHLALNPLTEDLAQHFGWFQMSRRGIAPLLNYIEQESTAEPLAVGRPLETTHTVEILRQRREPARPGDAPPPDRLLLDQHITIDGYRRSGSAFDLGADDGQGPRVTAGRVRFIQIFTRPHGAPGERAVTEVPHEFGALEEQPLAEPYPTEERLHAVPPGFAEVAVYDRPDAFGVWGRGNTDINHHVTVTEYLRALERNFYGVGRQGGLPLARVKLDRLRGLFRKPSFAGDGWRVRSVLYRNGDQVRTHAALHRVDETGTSEPRAAVVATLEGQVLPAEAE